MGEDELDDALEDPEEGRFPATEGTPGQVESRASYARLEEMARKIPWWEEYLQLRFEGWDWRKAAYMAWAVMPSNRRWPETQEALAKEVLGLKSDRTIRKWLEKQPEMRLRIEQLKVGMLGAHLSDVIEAWVTVAKMPDPSAHKDRITYLEHQGVYKPRGAVELSGPGGGPIEQEVRYADKSDDELKQMAKNLGKEL